MTQVKIISLLLMLSILTVDPAFASSPSSWKALDQKSAKACISKSGLRQARIGPAMRFSDRMMVDARIVEGRYRQRHMNGASVKMLCLYNRKLDRAEVQELK
jgi:hypothetical protein